MDQIITSASNPTVKRLRKLLTSSKARRHNNQYVAEGIHLVRSFLATGKTPVLCATAESAADNHEVGELVGQLAAVNTERAILSDDLFTSVTSIHASVGIVIIFSPDNSPTDALSDMPTGAVALEDIQDPGNIGTILRTTAAVGIRHVLLTAGCASPWSPKALRAGMGAQFSLTIHEEVDLADTLAATTLPVLTTLLSAHSTSLYDADLTGPAVWLFGNEGQGVSETLTRQATTTIHIPQADSAVESLNVAAAAAICLYEQYRQNYA